MEQVHGRKGLHLLQQLIPPDKIGKKGVYIGNVVKLAGSIWGAWDGLLREEGETWETSILLGEVHEKFLCEKEA